MTGSASRRWPIAWSLRRSLIRAGYPKGRKTADALARIWREVEAGYEWIVDADLKDYFGSVDHEKLMALGGPLRPGPSPAGDYQPKRSGHLAQAIAPSMRGYGQPSARKANR
jgi:hypothetical protein